MSLKTPRSMKVEHEELHEELRKATKEKGPLGDAAKAVAKVLHPHFVKEEDYAMPPLGLLSVLAEGRVSAKMKDAIMMTNKLKKELNQMLKKHKEMVSALKKLVVEAKKEKMHKIELGIVEENKIALHLYEKFGFQIEGVSKDAFYGHDDKYQNMVHVGLILKT